MDVEEGIWSIEGFVCKGLAVCLDNINHALNSVALVLPSLVPELHAADHPIIVILLAAREAEGCQLSLKRKLCRPSPQ